MIEDSSSGCTGIFHCVIRHCGRNFLSLTGSPWSVMGRCKGSAKPPGSADGSSAGQRAANARRAAQWERGRLVRRPKRCQCPARSPLGARTARPLAKEVPTPGAKPPGSEDGRSARRELVPISRWWVRGNGSVVGCLPVKAPGGRMPKERPAAGRHSYVEKKCPCCGPQQERTAAGRGSYVEEALLTSPR